MKKVLLMFAFIATLLVGSIGTAGAQVTYTVYDGTNTSSQVPVYGYYCDNYLKCEYVIPADHLTAINGSTISALKFYSSTASADWGSANFRVFLKEVAGPTISNYSGYADATEVYMGSLSISGNEMVVNFTTNYTYNGGNLLIGFYNEAIGSWVSASFYGKNINGSCVQGNASNSLSNVTANQRNFIPKTTFTVDELHGCLTPTNLAVSDVTTYGATVTWTPGNTETDWVVKFNDDEYPVSGTPSYTVTGLTPNTSYVASVKAVCGDTEESEYTTPGALFTTLPTCPAPTAVTVSNITTNSVDIAWTENSTANEWIIDYNGTEISATTNPFPLTGLNASTNYTVKVKAVCSEEDESDWSDTTNFATECGTFMVTETTPYFQGFESTTFPPTCWSRNHTAGTSTNTWGRNTYTVHTGNGSAQLEDQQSGNINDLVTGMLNIPEANTYQVNFWMQRSHYSTLKPNEGVKVWVNTTPDTVGGTEIMYIHREYTLAPAEEATGWYEYSAVIPTSGDMYVIFQGISEWGTASYIDDITVNKAPSCLKPTAVTVSNVTAHTADIAWTNGGTEPAWTIDYNGTEIAADSNPFTLTGLDAATNYTVKVKANCSEESESEWSTIVNFLTECETNTTFPYVQDFEATTFPPTCWSQSRTSEGNSGSFYGVDYPDGAWARNASTQNGNATGKAQLRDTRAGSIHALVTGAMDFTYENGYILSVDVCRNATGTSYLTEGIRIFVNSEPEVNANATELAFISRNYTVASTVNPDIVGTETASGWYTYELPITATGVNYIIFQGESQYGNSTFMDNVRIGEAPTCPKPTGVTISNVTAHTADIAWTAAEETEWVLSVNGEESVIAENPYTLTGLTPVTNYSIALRAICSATDTSEWSNTVAFTTTVSCPAPSALTVSNITENSAEISWTAGDENSWVIEYNDMTEVITSNPYTLTGLTAETNYDVRIRAICAENDSSAWSSTLAVYTGMCVPAPTSVDGSGIVNVTFGVNQIVNNATHPTTAPYYGDYTSMVGDVAAGLNANVDITFNTCGYSCYDYGTVIWVNWNNDLAFTDDEVVFTGRSAEVANAVLSCSFPVPANTPAGEYRMRIGAADSYFDDAIEDGEGFNPCSSSTYTVYEDYTLSVTEAPECVPVTNVTINNITAHSAEISWTSQGNESAWEIEYNGTTEVITTNPYSLTGLDAATDYSVRVRSICSETDTSVWSAAAVFTTECDNITTFPYVQDFESTMFPPICWFQERTNAGTSSYGTEYPDGAWTQNVSIQNGNATGKAQLRDTRAGSVHALVTGSMDFTYENGYILSVDVCRNATGTSYLNEGIRIFVNSEPEVNTNATELAFISRNHTVASTVNSDIVGAETASGWYTYELPITATGVNYIIFQGESQYGSSTYMDNVIVDETPTCAKPTAVTVSNITETTADIAWTENGTAEEWTIEYNGTEVSATTNPFTLTGLDASTLYTVKVKAICSEEDESDWSNEVSFRTECAAVAIPFFESFEENDLGCWTTEETNASYTWHIVSTLSYGYTGGMADGQYAAAMTCSSSSTQYTAKLISPVLDLSTTMFPSLTFSYLNGLWGSDQNILRVYYRTDASAEWTLLNTYNNNVTSWTEETISLPNPTATYQIAFEGETHYGYNIHVDAVSVEGTSCPAPTNVVVSNETETSADVNWTAGYEETAWNIRYREIPEAVFYDFEDGMQGWTTVDADGDNNNWMHEDCSELPHNTPYEGNGCVYSESYNGAALTPDNWLISPEVNLTGMVKFMAAGQDPEYPDEHFAVYVIEGQLPATIDATTISAFTQIGTEQVATGEYTEYTFDLSGHTGMGHVAIRHFNVSDEFVLVVDNITIGEEPGEWTVVEGVTNPYTITGLTANTTYEVQVQAACSEDDASAWTASVEFTTLGDSSVVEPCEVPANIAVEHNVVTWESEAENFNLMYIVANDTTTVQVAGNTYTVEGLEEGTVVTVMVQAICDENNVSDWSEATEFTFEGVGINNYGLTANVYPNPTHDVVNVECSAIGADLSVYDMFGKVIMNTTIQSERTELNLSNVAPGVYMIRIANNNAITTVKVVKE